MESEERNLVKEELGRELQDLIRYAARKMRELSLYSSELGKALDSYTTSSFSNLFGSVDRNRKNIAGQYSLVELLIQLEVYEDTWNESVVNDYRKTFKELQDEIDEWAKSYKDKHPLPKE